MTMTDVRLSKDCFARALSAVVAGYPTTAPTAARQRATYSALNALFAVLRSAGSSAVATAPALRSVAAVPEIAVLKRKEMFTVISARLVAGFWKGAVNAVATGPVAWGGSMWAVLITCAFLVGPKNVSYFRRLLVEFGHLAPCEKCRADYASLMQDGVVNKLVRNVSNMKGAVEAVVSIRRMVKHKVATRATAFSADIVSPNITTASAGDLSTLRTFAESWFPAWHKCASTATRAAPRQVSGLSTTASRAAPRAASRQVSGQVRATRKLPSALARAKASAASYRRAMAKNPNKKAGCGCGK